MTRNIRISMLLLALLLIEVVKASNIDKTFLELNGFTTDSVKIDLSKQGISTIDPATFVDFKKLEILYLNENKINRIESGTFNQLVNLRELWLESNYILFIPRNETTKLINLKLICINNNPVSSELPAEMASLCGNKNCDVEIKESCKNRIVIESPLITNWGDWQIKEKCSPNNYVSFYY